MLSTVIQDINKQLWSLESHQFFSATLKSSQEMKNQLLTVFAILSLLSSWTSACYHHGSFTKTPYYNKFANGGNVEECQKSCQKDPDCNAFTVRDLNCHFHFKDGFKVYAGSSYVTGPKTCPACYYFGSFTDTPYYQKFENGGNVEKCQESCQNDKDCNAFTVKGTNCYFHLKDGVRVYAGTDYTTGSKYCPRLGCNGKDDGCCTSDRPCANGQGDCDNDADCASGKCGSYNCDRTNGLYDSTDDCCL